MRGLLTVTALALAACGGSGDPTDPMDTAPDSVYVATGTYELAEVTLIHEGSCLDLYDRPGGGETWMSWFAAELEENGGLSIDYRADEYCYVDGDLASGVNAAGTALGRWELVGRDSLAVTLSNAIDDFIVLGAWFAEGELISGVVDGVVRIRPDTMLFAVEPGDGVVVGLKLARGG